MKISRKQLATLGEAGAIKYEHRLVEFLRANVAAGSEGEVQAGEVRARIAEACASGLDTERQIAAYVTGVWVFGDEFLARIEPMRESFADPCVAPDAKASMLIEQFDALSRESSEGRG